MINITVIGSSSEGNSYLVTDGKTPLLLDAGVPFKQIQKSVGFKMSSIKGVLITHEHGDHIKAVKDILSKTTLQLYMSPGTALSIKQDGHHKIKPIRHLESFSIGTWTVIPFNTAHDASEPLGFVLVNDVGERLLFATDTYYIEHKFDGITHMLIECNYSKEVIKLKSFGNVTTDEIKAYAHRYKRLLESHMSLETLKSFLSDSDLSRLKEIHLIHLSDSNSDEERFRREIQEMIGKPVYIAGKKGDV